MPLGGAAFYSTMDLCSGFWQTAVDPRDIGQDCVRHAPWAVLFQSAELWSGNTPSLFQRIMDLVLVGLTWSTRLVYVDDVICFASSFEEHVERLGQDFARLSAAGLKLKPSV